MLTSPVLELQKESGASIGESYGWQLPRAYSNLNEEYSAATEGVALVDRSHIGRIRVSGNDALDLLTRLSSNKMEDLKLGEMMGTVLTSNKGRILDLLFVLSLEDHLLMFTSPQTRQKVIDHVDFYIFTEDVTLEDVTENTSTLGLLGPAAAGLLDSITSPDARVPDLYGSTYAKIGDNQVLIVRTDFAGVPEYDLIVPSSQAQGLWTRILDEGKQAGVKPVGTEALEVVRVEHGIPAYGKDMSESNNPLEANLKDAFISFHKECYIGQEVVARLDTYDKVQKYLVGLTPTDNTALEEGAVLYLDGKKTGGITSVAQSPRLGSIALGYVRKAQAKAGTRLTAGETAVHVVELPFSAA